MAVRRGGRRLPLSRLVVGAPPGVLRARPDRRPARLREVRRVDDAGPGALPRLLGRVPAGSAAGVRPACARRRRLGDLPAPLRRADGGLRRARGRVRGARPRGARGGARPHGRRRRLRRAWLRCCSARSCSRASTSGRPRSSSGRSRLWSPDGCGSAPGCSVSASRRSSGRACSSRSRSRTCGARVGGARRWSAAPSPRLSCSPACSRSSCSPRRTPSTASGGRLAGRSRSRASARPCCSPRTMPSAST